MTQVLYRTAAFTLFFDFDRYRQELACQCAVPGAGRQLQCESGRPNSLIVCASLPPFFKHCADRASAAEHLVPNQKQKKTRLLRVQLLGRADNVRDFVRKGSSTGMTEIHLSSGQTRPIIITRHMSACDNKSKWLLNGE